jgi:hypothetical protein
MADNPIGRNKPTPMVIGVGPNGRLSINGEELERNDPRMYGRAGRNITQEMERYGSHNGRNFDERYYYTHGIDSDGNEANSGLASRDSRLRPDVAEQLNGRVQLAQAGVGGWSEVIDPSKVQYDPEFGLVTAPENIRRMDPSNDRYDQALMIAATAGIGGAMAAHAMAAMGAPAAAGGVGGAEGAAAGAGGLEGAGGAAAFEIPGPMAQIAQPGAMNAMAPAFSLPAEAGGGLASLGAESLGGGGSAASGALTPAEMAGGVDVGYTGAAGEALPATGSSSAGPASLANGGSGLGSVVDAMGGPQGVARMAGGLASLGAAGGGGGGGGGGSGDAQSIIDQMANANRVDHNTPIGSRRWSQDPQTGRWTVNDSMSDVEQANFGNVQQLNAGVTGMARDRLAQLLAQGPRQRYDRPLGT